MDILENIKKVVQEMILPEIGTIKDEYKEIKTILQRTDKRIDDMNIHLVDQSRRIDETNKRIDETNKRIEEINGSLIARIDKVNGSLIARIDEINKRIDRLYEVIVRRDEHNVVEMRITKVEQDVTEIKMEILKLAA